MLAAYATHFQSRISQRMKPNKVNQRDRQIMEAYVQHRSDPSIIMPKFMRIELKPATESIFLGEHNKVTSEVAGSMIKFRYKTLSDRSMYELLDVGNIDLMVNASAFRYN
ncbi:hypothetical protein H4R33_003413 [Dimargaris cristalligena]|nr:hypothetical protein H4R33_003413 [Dimargaris cristalligena]